MLRIVLGAVALRVKQGIVIVNDGPIVIDKVFARIVSIYLYIDLWEHLESRINPFLHVLFVSIIQLAQVLNLLWIMQQWKQLWRKNRVCDLVDLRLLQIF